MAENQSNTSRRSRTLTIPGLSSVNVTTCSHCVNSYRLNCKLNNDRRPPNRGNCYFLRISTCFTIIPLFYEQQGNSHVLHMLKRIPILQKGRSKSGTVPPWSTRIFLIMRPVNGRHPQLVITISQESYHNRPLNDQVS